MSRVMVASGLSLWLGATLLLSQLRWFARRPTVERLRPYVPIDYRVDGGPGVFSVATFRDLAAPLSQLIGGHLARLFGVTEDVGLRLRRIHSPIDAATFRLRQLVWSLVVTALGATISLIAGLGPIPAFGLVTGGALLTFLVLEQQLSMASRSWQRRVFLELPVLSEQLAMLLAAGYSLGGGLHRLAERGQGACARDLSRVMTRVTQGLDEVTALEEWAELVQVPAVDRLVAVLGLNQQATDLSTLIAEETRSVRRDVQRELMETIERRAQMVWIPVTVATLVPGVIFLAIPFFETMRLFATS